MAARRLQVVSQDAEVQPQEGARPEHVVLEAPDFRGPWFDTETAAAYLQYRGPGRLESVYRFIKTNGIAVRRRSVRSHPKHAVALEAAAVKCEQEGTRDACREAERVARAAAAAAYAAAYAAAARVTACSPNTPKRSCKS